MMDVNQYACGGCDAFHVTECSPPHPGECEMLTVPMGEGCLMPSIRALGDDGPDDSGDQ